MALVMKSGKKVKNFLASKEKNTIKYKKALLAKAKLNAPLFSWPKDKERLLDIINHYLSQVELDKLTDMADAFDDGKVNGSLMDELVEESKKELEGKDSETDSSQEEQSSQENSQDDETKESDKKDESESQESTTEELSEEARADEVETDSEIEEDSFVDEGEYIELPDQLYDCEACSAKVLGNIVRILNYRSRIIRKIRLMRKAKFDNERINLEIEKVAVYNIVLAKFLPILNKQETIDKINLKTATKLFEDVCVEGYEEIPSQASIETEIKKNKESQDFDIVAALAYVGVTVDKDDYGYYSIRNYNNGRGIKYFIGKAEKAFALSKNSCNRFVDEFLNKPIEKRKFMTPGQVFITYINEAEKSLGISSRSAVELQGLFGAMNSSKNTKQYFKDMIKKYSRNAEEWKDFQKLFEGEYYSNKESKDDIQNKIHIKQQAKRLVIGEVFSELINYGDILSQEQIGINDYRISDITRDFGLDVDISGIDVNRTRIERLEDQSFRIINSMHSILQQLRSFTQDIIDNYTVDYLRKEKIFLMQQEDQNEYIRKKKEYEDLIKKLSYDKDKDSGAKSAYYQAQIDELTQKIGNQDYLDAKNILLKSKNNFRILLINAKAQKEKVIIAINEAKERAEAQKRTLTIEEKIDIIRDILSSAPELIITFNRGKATSWTKHKVGEKAEKRQEPLSEVDKTIEATAAKISDESHQKILQENMIREKVKKSQKEERVKSVNAYINAYGSIVGNATGVGAFGGIMPSIPASAPTTTGPTFAPQVASMPMGTPNTSVPAGAVGGGIGGNPQSASVATPRTIASLHSAPPMFGDVSDPGIVPGYDASVDMSATRNVARNTASYASANTSNNSMGGGMVNNYSAPVQPQVQSAPPQPTYVAPVPQGGYV